MNALNNSRTPHRRNTLCQGVTLTPTPLGEYCNLRNSTLRCVSTPSTLILLALSLLLSNLNSYFTSISVSFFLSTFHASFKSFSFSQSEKTPGSRATFNPRTTHMWPASKFQYNVIGPPAVSFWPFNEMTGQQ